MEKNVFFLRTGIVSIDPNWFFSESNSLFTKLKTIPVKKINIKFYLILTLFNKDKFDLRK